MAIQVKFWRQMLPVLIISMIVTQPSWAGSLNLNGTWRYSRTDAEDSDSFAQNYSAAYTGAADLTDLASVKGNIRYTRNINDDKISTLKKE